MWVGSLLLEAVALVGGTVHTLEPDVAPRVATVLIDDGRITAIGEDLEVPPGTRRVDCSGLHLVPGLIDSLANLDPAHDALWVAGGVTFVVDVGADVDRTLAERAPAARDRVPGPGFATAGAVLGGDPPVSPGALVVRTPDEARELVAGLEEQGVDFLCVQPGLARESYLAVIAAGREHGLGTFGPLVDGATLGDALDAGLAGLHFLDGLLPVDPTAPPGERTVPWTIVLPRALRPAVERLAASTTAVIPVLGALKARLETPDGKLGAFELLAPHYAVWWGQEWLGRQRTFDERVRADGQRVLDKQLALLRELVTAGARVVPGSGAPHPWLVPGAALHEEFALWVEAGIAPYEVLARATRVAADVFGLAGERGTLTVGKVADLLVVEGDPREGLGGLAKPHAVVLRGRVLERATLDELVERLRADEAARRAKDSEPLEIEAPVLPEGVAPLLAGEVESRTLGSRVSGERWAIGREADGALLFVGRLLRPGDEKTPASELQIQQRVRDGLVVAFAVRLLSAGDELTAVGQLVGSALHVRREYNGVHVSTEQATQPITAVALGNLGGSATTALVLGQRPKQGRAWVLALGQLFEPGAMEWEIVDQPEGRFVRTHAGAMVLEFEPNGALAGWGQGVGQAQVATVSRESTAFGGPGLPAQLDPEAGARYVEDVRRRREQAAGGAPPQPEPQPQPQPVPSGG